MKRIFVILLLFSFTFAEPKLVYNPPFVLKFETALYVGKPEKGKTYLRAGFDYRIGYPFLAGIFYGKRDTGEEYGLRAKVRVPLFWKVKNDFSVGVALFRNVGVFTVSAEQIVFLKRSFSLRLMESYFFGNKEAEQWVISLGLGF